MFLLIVFAASAICISFLCSVLEAVLLSITPSFIAQLRESKARLYARFSELKTNMDSPLAAILTLNTIAHHCSARPASVLSGGNLRTGLPRSGPRA